MPPQIVTRRSVDQLAAILSLSPYPSRGVRPRNVLEDLWFWTAPRATGIPGLCQADQVVMHFAPDYVPSVDGDTPTRVRGISATTKFHFLTPPALTAWDELPPEKAAQADADCRRLDPEEVSFFEAVDAEYANSSAILLNKMLEQIMSGQPRFELVCTNSDEPCTNLFEGLSPRDLSEVRRCNRNEDEFNIVCTQFRLGDLRIDVTWPFAGTPDLISKVTVAEMVVLVHERID